MDDDVRAFVIRTAEEREIRFIRLWFTDILGFLKSFAIPAEELPEALTEGVGFDGSSIDGFARVQEADMVAHPDPSTFQTLPWRPGMAGVARMFCDIRTPEGTVFDGDPRAVLRRAMSKANEHGVVVLRRPRDRVLPVRRFHDARCRSTSARISTSPRWMWAPTSGEGSSTTSSSWASR